MTVGIGQYLSKSTSVERYPKMNALWFADSAAAGELSGVSSMSDSSKSSSVSLCVSSRIESSWFYKSATN
jgi:hypothetical protein